MKLFTICCILVVVVARPPDNYYPGTAQILKYINVNNGIDGFNYEFEQSDGTKVQAQGNIAKVFEDGKEVEVLIIQGSYSFVNNGVTYTVRYVADQNGYHPTVLVGPGGAPGTLLPLVPGVPGAPQAAPISPLIYASLLGSG